MDNFYLTESAESSSMHEPTQHRNTLPQDQKALELPQKRTGRKIALVLMFVIVGTAFLGLGLAIGNEVGQLIGQNITQVEEPAHIPIATDVSTVRINPLTTPISPMDPDVADIIPMVKDAVVSISVLAANARPFGMDMPGSGSGFIFYEDDDFVYIATNNHVIEHARQITVSLDDNENITAMVVDTSPEHDLAVIAVRRDELLEKGVPHIVAALGDSSIMRMGDTVLAIGNAMGEGQTVTKGIVSALGLSITVGDPGQRNILQLDVMQTDAAVNRGNSGGPLLNRNGEVIGVVTAKMMGSDIEGMGYALPINEASTILFELLETGIVQTPFIGIQHEEFSEFMRNLFNLPYTGLLVRGVVQNSPAQAAGIEVDDLIIYYNGVRTYNMRAFVEELGNTNPGDVVDVIVFRAGERVTLSLVLGVAWN